MLVNFNTLFEAILIGEDIGLLRRTLIKEELLRLTGDDEELSDDLLDTISSCECYEVGDDENFHLALKSRHKYMNVKHLKGSTKIIFSKVKLEIS